MSSLILKRASASRLRDGIERSNTLRAGKIDVLISLNYPSEGARLDVGPLRGALHRADRERLSAILTPPRSRPGAHDGEPEPSSATGSCITGTRSRWRAAARRTRHRGCAAERKMNYRELPTSDLIARLRHTLQPSGSKMMICSWSRN
jgi:hypothetical protein